MAVFFLTLTLEKVNSLFPTCPEQISTVKIIDSIHYLHS